MLLQKLSFLATSFLLPIKKKKNKKKNNEKIKIKNKQDDRDDDDNNNNTEIKSSLFSILFFFFLINQNIQQCDLNFVLLFVHFLQWRVMCQQRYTPAQTFFGFLLNDCNTIRILT